MLIGSHGALRRRPLAPVFFEPNTNIIANPQAINLWPTLTNAVVSANAAFDPQGNLTAETITDNNNGATGAVNVNAATSTFVTSTLYRASVYAKLGVVPFLRLSILNIATLNLTAYFSLLSAPTLSGTSVNVIRSGMEESFNGWWRCWFTFMSDSVDTSGNLLIGLAIGNSNANIFRDGTKTLHVWLAQTAAV